MLLFSAASSAASQNQTVTATTCHTCQISANQLAKNPRPVELHGRGKGRMMGMSESEWEDRLELAALGRIMYMYGFGSDLAAQCIMARVRDDPDAMLMNEWGFFFEETTATSLVKVRFGAGTPSEGTFVSPSGQEYPSSPDVVNIGCVPVGRAIFNARPDTNVIIHAHPYPVMAVGATEQGLLPLSQAAFFLHDIIGRYKYDFSCGPLRSSNRFRDGQPLAAASAAHASVLTTPRQMPTSSSARLPTSLPRASAQSSSTTTASTPSAPMRPTRGLSPSTSSRLVRSSCSHRALVRSSSSPTSRSSTSSMTI